MEKTRYHIFQFRVNNDERRLIEALAHRLQRSQSDMLRFLIHAACHELSLHSVEADINENGEVNTPKQGK